MFESIGPPKAFQYVAHIFHNQNYLTNTETNHIQVRDQDNGYTIFSFQT